MRWAGLALFIAVWAPACGPIQTTQVLVAADAELQAARRAQAEQQARYEVEMASAYLREARRAHGRARYQDAVQLGERALACAEAALRIAQGTPEPEGAAPCDPDYSRRELPEVATSSTSTSTEAAP